MADERAGVPEHARTGPTDLEQIHLHVSRRSFLGASGIVAGVALAGFGLAACSKEVAFEAGVLGPPERLHNPYPKVAQPPAEVPELGELEWFSAEQGRTVDALVAVLMPGTPEDPGAREAGVLTYIDYKLANSPGGTATRHYPLGPFATPVKAGEALPESTDEAVYVPEDILDRYGPQSALNPQEQYTKGLEYLDKFSRQVGGAGFAELSEADQMTVVSALADDTASGFEKPGAQDFFNMVRSDVVEGMFSDPAYGGNRGMVGWKLVGYPGAQRAYTPAYVAGKEPEFEPQSLMDMPSFHGGQPDGPNVVLPLSGSRGGREDAGEQGR